MKIVSKSYNLRNFYSENLGRINSSLVKIINIIINFFLYFFLLRRLGLSNAGLIYACLNLNILIIVIAQVGFKFSIVKYISQFFIQDKFNEIKKLIIFSTKIQGWLSLFITLILIIGISQLNQLLFSEIDFKNELVLFILSIPFLLIKDNNAFIIQGLGAPILALVINILLLPFFLILGILVFPIENTFDFSLIYLFSSLSNFVFSQKIREYIWSKNYNDKLINESDNNFFDKNSFLNFSLNAWKITLLSVFIPRVTELLVSIFSSPVDVTIFSTSLRISLLLNIPMIGTNQFIARLIASSFKINDFDKIKNVFEKSLKFINIISLPIFIFIILFPDFILNIFSSEITNSGNILRILAISSLAKIILGPNEIILSMCGFEKYIFKSLLISFLISISSCIYLLPKIGLLGACFSLNIGNILNSILLRLKFNKFINLNN